MRGLIRTLGHLIVILIVVAAIVAILFAIPGSRYWLLREVPGAAVGLMAPASMSQLVRGAVSELDPKAVAEIINDKETRGELIKLIENILRDGVEVEATAELVNGILAHPNLGNFVTKLLPQLDAYAVADLVNQIVEAPRLIDLVNGLVSKLEPAPLADLVNQLVEDPDTIKLINGLVSELDASSLAYLLNKVVASEGTVKLVNGLIPQLDTGALAVMMNELVGIEVEGKVVANPTLINLVSGLVAKLNPQTLGDFLNQLLIPEGVVNENLVGFINSLIGGLEGESLGNALSPMLSSSGMINLLNGLMGSWPTDATIKFIDGIWPAFEEKIFPYLWLKGVIRNIGILGIEEIPILGPILEELGETAQITMILRFTKITWGHEIPIYEE